MRNEKGEITKVTAEYKIPKKPISQYYEWLYSNEFDNLEEMDNFLDLQHAKT